MGVSVERQAVIARHRWLMVLPVLIASAALGVVYGAPLFRPALGPQDILAAHERAREGDWTTAFLVARAYTVQHPECPVGHFLLGQCYLYGERVQLTLASGELETALRLYERTGNLGAWEGIVDGPDFMSRVHKIRGVVELRIVREALNHHLPVPFIRRHLLEGIEQVKRGLELMPGESSLIEMEAAMRKLLDELRLAPPPRPLDDSNAAFNI
jgi:hypothetical protein